MLRVKFEFSHDTDYPKHRQIIVEGDWCGVVVRQSPDKKNVLELCSLAEPNATGRVPTSMVAERRPDGLWYTSRDWDAVGYDRWMLEVCRAK